MVDSSSALGSISESSASSSSGGAASSREKVPCISAVAKSSSGRSCRPTFRFGSVACGEGFSECVNSEVSSAERRAWVR